MKRCPKCGYENPDDIEYCRACYYVFKKGDRIENIGLEKEISGESIKLKSTIGVEKKSLPPLVTCVNHPDIEATGFCEICNRNFCSKCLQHIDGRELCINCVSKYRSQKEKAGTTMYQVKILVGLLVIIPVAIWTMPRVVGWTLYNKYGISSIPIDTSNDPIQEPFNPPKVIERDWGKMKLKIQLLTSYDISAKVVGRKKWWRKEDLGARLSPIDLSLVWGELAEEKNAKTVKSMKIGHSLVHRASRFSIPKGDFPWSREYCLNHFSNNHLIPATKKIKYAIRRIKKGDFIRLEGYLVYLEAYENGRMLFYWGSSLSRTDRTPIGGWCEVIYVTKVQINDRVYQ